MKKRNIYILAEIILSVLFLVPYMGIVFYALPRGDEFSSAAGIIKGGGYSLPTIFRYVANLYMRWEGNYTGHFMFSALNPLLLGGIDAPVYILNVLFFISFVIAMLFIVNMLMKVFSLEQSDRKFISFLVVILSMNCRFLREMLAWFTGFTYYTLELLLGLIAFVVIASLTAKDNAKGTKMIVAVAICLLSNALAVGGSLQVSAIICYIDLLLLIYCIYARRDKYLAILLFAVAVLFTLIDVLAPGYAIRKSGYDESVSIIKAVIYSVVCVYHELERLCIETFIPYAFLVLAILLCIFIKEGKKKIYLNPVFVACAGLIGLVGSTLPVCYGYASPEIASRGYEVLDILIVLFGTLFIGSMVNYLKLSKVEITKGTATCFLCMIAMLFCTVALRVVPFNSIPSVECALRLADGSIKDYSDYWRDVMHQLEESTDEDVVIDVERKYMYDKYMIDRCSLEENPEDYVNISCCTIYGHNSIRMNVID